MRLWDNAGALKRINSSLYLLAAVGLIAAAVMWMMNSPYFPVKLVKIDGDLHRLSATQLQQIAQLLQLQDNPHRNSREVKQLTAQHIETLNAQIHALQKMVAELQRWHDNCQGNDCPECSILEGLSE